MTFRAFSGVGSNILPWSSDGRFAYTAKVISIYSEGDKEKRVLTWNYNQLTDPRPQFPGDLRDPFLCGLNFFLSCEKNQDIAPSLASMDLKDSGDGGSYAKISTAH